MRRPADGPRTWSTRSSSSMGRIILLFLLRAGFDRRAAPELPSGCARAQRHTRRREERLMGRLNPAGEAVRARRGDRCRADRPPLRRARAQARPAHDGARGPGVMSQVWPRDREADATLPAGDRAPPSGDRRARGARLGRDRARARRRLRAARGGGLRPVRQPRHGRAARRQRPLADRRARHRRDRARAGAATCSPRGR